MNYYVRFIYSSFELVASNFAKNQENFKGGLCLNVITPFTIIVVVLLLRDVPKTIIWVNQNWVAQVVVRGGTAPPGPPVATALVETIGGQVNAKR